MNFTKELPAGEASHAARPRIAGTAADEPRPGNPYDGHTLGVVIEDTERLAGCEIEHVYVDKGSHRAANPLRVFISDQKRGVFGVIKRELTHA
jgi:hypothetical protein